MFNYNKYNTLQIMFVKVFNICKKIDTNKALILITDYYVIFVANNNFIFFIFTTNSGVIGRLRNNRYKSFIKAIISCNKNNISVIKN